MIPAQNSSQAQLNRPAVLLLQGPVGPFFRELHRQFSERGFRAVKVNFNGGDLLFPAAGETLDFQGSLDDWTAWLEVFAAKQSPIAIVLFGDGRPYHAEALRVAEERGITTWCLEEGYIRPDYVTCEKDGNNARSPLRREPLRKGSRATGDSRSVANPFRAMATYAALHAVAHFIFGARFERNLKHRSRSFVADCVGWARCFGRKLMSLPTNRLILHRATTQRLRDYYVVALQVHDDLNLLRNGCGWTMEQLIEETTRSFAENASPVHNLLFKVHPLDRGHLPYRRLITAAARRYQCVPRVSVVDDGPIGPLIRHSRGVVTVNSTSGLSALRHGKPLAVLGHAVYSTPALKTSPPAEVGDLDAFWKSSVAAAASDTEAFFERMLSESLVGGNFYVPAERAATASAIADRVFAEYFRQRFTELKAIDSRRNRGSETSYERMVG